MSSIINIARQAMRAQSANMSAIGNNIANLRTVGYKRSRTHFSEVIGGTNNAANAAGFNGGTIPSEGSTAQSFSGINAFGTRNFLGDGQLQQTNRALDFAIQGSGQFVVREYSGAALDQEGEIFLTSAGNFELRSFNPTGIASATTEGLYLSDQNGHNVMGSLYDETSGTFAASDSLDSLQPIRFNNWATTSVSPAIRSSNLTVSGNVNSAAEIGTRIDLGVSVYNGTGIANADGTKDSGLIRDEIPLNVFLVKQAANVWSFVFVNAQRIDGEEVSDLTDAELPYPGDTPVALVDSENEQLANGWKIQFSAEGKPVRMWKGSSNFPSPTDKVVDLGGGALGQLTFEVTEPSPAALLPDPNDPSKLTSVAAVPHYVKAEMSLDLDLRNLTSFASDSGVDISQNGASIQSRQFKELSVDKKGIVYRHFDDGSRTPLAKVAAASARGINNLRPVSGSLYAFTGNSGDVTIHDFSSSGGNRLLSRTLESSDVDLSRAFTDMIVGQRSYSLSAQTLTTAVEMAKRAVDMK